MSETIEAVNGLVSIDIGSGYEREPESFTPAEARELAARIIAEADKCDVQKTAIQAACADGHEWGPGSNVYRSWPDDRAVSYWCQRNGCDGHKFEDGWVQFAAQLHVRFGRQVSCYGPGCEHCNEECIARDVQKLLMDGYKELEAEHLGSAFRRTN